VFKRSHVDLVAIYTGESEGITARYQVKQLLHEVPHGFGVQQDIGFDQRGEAVPELGDLGVEFSSQ